MYACHRSYKIVEENCRGKNSRNKIYEKQVARVIEKGKRKSNYLKGKFKAFRTQSILNYGDSVDLPFRSELYQKSYYVFKTLCHAANLLSFDVMN